jgi:hypothetical protein
MSKAKFTTMYAVDSERNGGYSRLGDGNMDATMYIEKEGVTIKLDNADVMNLMKECKFLNPTVSISY